MSRLLWLLLLPIIWVPLLVFLAVAIPALPWWVWAFAVVFWVYWGRRIRSAGRGDLAGVEGGVQWSPTRRSGGLW